MKQKSFTLIEILVTIAIIGILVGFTSFQISNYINAGKDAKRKADIKILANAVISYSSENYSNKPVSTTSCTLNETCSSEINSALSPFLETIPSDPDSNTYYTYQSDGNDCNISAVLSTGETYQYNCNTDQLTTNAPASGVCGSSDGQNLSSIPSTNLCSSGTASLVSGDGPWTWSCAGTYGGNTASCSTGGMPTAGVCGSSDGQSFSTAPSTNLCSSGTASLVDSPSSWTWSWTCAGENGGDTVSCSTSTLQDYGVCGSNAQTYAYDATAWPSTDSSAFCSYGDWQEYSYASVKPITDFPMSGKQIYWYCKGNGGNPGVSSYTKCSAARYLENATLFKSNWASRCTAAGGTYLSPGNNPYGPYANACVGITAIICDNGCTSCTGCDSTDAAAYTFRQYNYEIPYYGTGSCAPAMGADATYYGYTACWGYWADGEFQRETRE